MNYLRTPIFAIFLMTTWGAPAETRKALIYDIGKTDGAPRFTQTTQIETAGPNKSWRSEIRDGQNETVMTEKAEIKDGHIVYQYIEQRQIGEAYEMKTEGEKVTFYTFKLEDGKKGELKEKNTVNRTPEFITGPATEGYIQRNWETLMKGEVLDADFGIFELSKAIEFNFRKVASTEEHVRIKMRPGNFFFNIFVDPIFIVFAKSDQRLMRFIGRTPLREKVDGKWKPLDAEIIYPR